jgi:hypothetical protein
MRSVLSWIENTEALRKNNIHLLTSSKWQQLKQLQVR